MFLTTHTVSLQKLIGTLVFSGIGAEPVGASVPGTGEPRRTVPGRNQLQLCRAGQEVPTYVEPFRWGEDGGSARPPLRHPQLSARPILRPGRNRRRTRQYQHRQGL